jgi:hypothetical protein
VTNVVLRSRGSVSDYFFEFLGIFIPAWIFSLQFILGMSFQGGGQPYRVANPLVLQVNTLSFWNPPKFTLEARESYSHSGQCYKGALVAHQLASKISTRDKREQTACSQWRAIKPIEIARSKQPNGYGSQFSYN